MSKSKIDKRCFELHEVADASGLKLGTVRQYVANGIIPALYLGRKRVVRADVLERICNEGLKTPNKKDKEALLKDVAQ